jgi:SAM-dependent methyltransferase
MGGPDRVAALRALGKKKSPSCPPAPPGRALFHRSAASSTRRSAYRSIGLVSVLESWSRRFTVLRRRAQRERARRAEDRQRAYQIDKARQLAGALQEITPGFVAHAAAVRSRIEQVAPIDPNARVLEVGSGAHGLIFFLSLPNAIGLDPLADLYPSLFPEWQERAKTMRGYGEALPFGDASFDLVLSDNVVDHAERPDAILAEMARVLRPGGVFYFSVHVHHPIYAVASGVHAGWTALGVPWEIGPFADHTIHFTLAGIRAQIRSLPLRVLCEDTGIDAAKNEAKESGPQSTGDLIKRLFFKNARFEVVAVRR